MGSLAIASALSIAAGAPAVVPNAASVVMGYYIARITLGAPLLLASIVLQVWAKHEMQKDDTPATFTGKCHDPLLARRFPTVATLLIVGTTGICSRLTTAKSNVMQSKLDS
jgi:hypothetical protein